MADALNCGITLAKEHGSYHKTERALSKLTEALKNGDQSALKDKVEEFMAAQKTVKPHPDMLKSLEYAHERLKSGSTDLLIKAFKDDNLVGQKARLAEKVNRRLVKLGKSDEEFKKLAKETYPWSSYFSGEMNK